MVKNRKKDGVYGKKQKKVGCTVKNRKEGIYSKMK